MTISIHREINSIITKTHAFELDFHIPKSGKFGSSTSRLQTHALELEMEQTLIAKPKKWEEAFHGR
jgi:hypothetical protein